MDPSERITAEQALNHPYLTRISSPNERQTKKPSIFDRDSEVNKSHLHINNFLQQKSQKIGSRD